MRYICIPFPLILGVKVVYIILFGLAMVPWMFHVANSCTHCVCVFVGGCMHIYMGVQVHVCVRTYGYNII